MAKRFKLKFPSSEAAIASEALESPGLRTVVRNSKRNYISVEAPDVPRVATTAEAVGRDAASATSLIALAEQYGAEIVEDYQYDLESDASDFLFGAFESDSDASLTDVTTTIRADDAWARSTGEGATIAIVDTGVDGTHPEFPEARRAGHWEPEGVQPWTDWEGHGTMCATIAAASAEADGARYRGVAPDARIIACRSNFFDSELAAIYDFLIEQAAALDRPLIASNSFGRKTGRAPRPPQDSDFIDALDEAVAAGVIVFFSAGNNHRFAGGDAGACEPTSIWLHKSRADVFPVATCDLDREMWFYSSRGPGQHFGDAGTSRKPDVTAPTPRNGKILYGAGERVLADGWGTSGACPQVAGLAALMVSLDATLDRAAVFDILRQSAVGIGHGADCEGSGLIDCEAALAAVAARLTS